MKKLFLLCLFFLHVIHADYTWTPIPGAGISDSSTNSINPSIAVDPNGNSVAVWTNSSGVPVIQTATKLLGQSWIPGPVISSPSDPVSPFITPQVTVDNAGNALVVWQGSELMFATKPFGQAWSAPASVRTGAAGVFNLTMNGNGYAALIWSQNATTIFATTKQMGSATWAIPTQLDGPVPASTEPQIAMDPQGNVFASWNESTPAVAVADLPFGGTWSALTTFPTAVTQTSIGADGNGNAIVIWSTGGAIDYAIKLFNQPWSSSQAILGSTGGVEPNLVVGIAGNAMAVWDSSGQIASAYKPFGQPWTTPTVISGTGTFTNPMVKMDTCGTAVAYWDGTSVQVASNPQGQGWSPAFTLTTTGSNPSIGVNPCGHAVALWQDTFGASFNIEYSEGFLGSLSLMGLTGKQIKNNFGAVKAFDNHLKWAPTAGAVSYNVYSNGRLLQSVHKTKFTDPAQRKNQPKTYVVAPVDGNGNLSPPSIVTVK